MIVNFNTQFVDLDDNPVKDPLGKEVILSKFLASLLSQNVPSANKDAFKIDSLMKIARSLHKTGKADITDSEAELIQDAIIQSDASIMLKHQLKAVLTEAKAASATKEKK